MSLDNKIIAAFNHALDEWKSELMTTCQDRCVKSDECDEDFAKIEEYRKLISEHEAQQEAVI